jgi:glycosyltransferase involved in cell wall biosynthesis
MTAHTNSMILYITYDGILEPLGQSQVLGYLGKLSPQWRIHVISFEKRREREDAARMAAMRLRLREQGIGWTPLAYHKSPSIPATAYDITLGSIVTAWLAVRNRAAVLHTRSYVPALMALPAKRISGAKLLFDMRGFWADERVDGGLWPRGGVLYRVTKWLERLFLRNSDHVVTLTQASISEISCLSSPQNSVPPLTVIPTCADLDHFRPQKQPPSEPFVFGYVGSAGTWYLLDEIVSFYLALTEHRRDARLLFVNRNEQNIATSLHRSPECMPGRRSLSHHIRRSLARPQK